MRVLPLYGIASAFTAGIFARTFFNIGFPEIAFLLVLAIALLCVGMLRRHTFKTVSVLFLSSGACFFFALGILRLHVVAVFPSGLQSYAGEQVSFSGVITREPEVRETTTHLYIDPNDIGCDSAELVLVTVDTFSVYGQDISYGDVVRVSGKLKLPESFQGDTGRTFDYQGFLRAKGVQYVVNYAKVTILKEEEGTFLGSLFVAKKAFQKKIEEIIPEPHAGLGEGVLLGVKRAIGKDLENTFRDTGIIHIVVLSGYNIMLVVEGVMFVLALFFFPRMRMLIGLGVIILFALLVGLSATVVRASLMASLVLVARATGRNYAVLRALCITGVLMLIHNPYLLIYDPGFQLSFLATMGLILLSPYLLEKCTGIPTMLGIRNFFTATLATQVFVLPLLLYQMGTFSMVAILVNVLVLPMVPVAMFFTFLTGIVGFFSSTIGLGVGYIAYLSLGYIIAIAEVFGVLPFASYTVQAFPFWVTALSYGALALLLIFILKNETKKEKMKAITVNADIISQEYDEWEIVEDEEKTPETRSVSGVSSNFPFR